MGLRLPGLVLGVHTVARQGAESTVRGAVQVVEGQQGQKSTQAFLVRDTSALTSMIFGAEEAVKGARPVSSSNTTTPPLHTSTCIQRGGNVTPHVHHTAGVSLHTGSLSAATGHSQSNSHPDHCQLRTARYDRGSHQHSQCRLPNALPLQPLQASGVGEVCDPAQP